jgi:alpha-1,3-rhamnosyl/mannosyltransferase
LSFAVLGWGMKRSVRLATRVVFISNTFRQHFGSLTDKGEVIYLGREMDAALDLAGKSQHAPRSTLRLREPYILCVSHVLPYKNLGALILGYAQERARLKARGLRLYIVGKAVSAGEYAKLQRSIERWDLHEWVVLTGPVPETEVAALFPLAEFVVFQSTCENCPSTLIEALSAGAPIACSSASSMPEIAATAVLYFDPFSPSEIGVALVRLAYDAELRANLGARARIRAEYFPSWEKVAADTLKILQAAASNAVADETSVCAE